MKKALSFDEMMDDRELTYYYECQAYSDYHADYMNEDLELSREEDSVANESAMNAEILAYFGCDGKWLV